MFKTLINFSVRPLGNPKPSPAFHDQHLTTFCAHVAYSASNPPTSIMPTTKTNWHQFVRHRQRRVRRRHQHARRRQRRYPPNEKCFDADDERRSLAAAAVACASREQRSATSKIWPHLPAVVGQAAVPAGLAPPEPCRSTARSSTSTTSSRWWTISRWTTVPIATMTTAGATAVERRCRPRNDFLFYTLLYVSDFLP